MISNIKRSLIKVWYGFRIGKPKLLLKVGRSLIKGKLFGKIPLKYLDIAIDYRCNFRCEHCFAHSFVRDNRKRKQMDIEDYRKLYEEASKLGAFDFNFQGGEPLLFMERLEKIIKVFRPSENFISVTTNAFILDEEKIDKLKKWGVDLIVVSVDSGLPEEHDKFRNVEGSFDRAMKAIDLALSKGLKVSINTTIWKGNIYSEGLKRLVDYVDERGIFLNPILAAPSGKWEDNVAVVLDKKELKHLDDMMKKKWFMRRDTQANLIKPGCGGVKESLYVTAYGDILGCPFIHVSFGNIKDMPLKEIRDKGLGTKYFGTYWPICLIGEDRQFMKDYLKRIHRKKLPASYSDFKESWEGK